MNKRQWQILAIGVTAIVSVFVLGTSRPQPPIAGPGVEYAPGSYYQNFTDAIIPAWVVLGSLGLAVLTGAAIYRSRTSGAA